MRIGVSGASGALGRGVVQELRRRAGGHDLVAISRTPNTANGVEGRLGDYDRPETLTSAYVGLDRLLLIPSPDLRPGVLSTQILAGIDAAVACDVSQILLLSGAGTRRASGYADHWTGEQRLVRSDAKAWTILRMNFFAETFVDLAKMSLATGVLPALSESRVAFVSRDDVAAALAGALLKDGQDGATFNLSGPVGVTGHERAALVAQASGKPLTFTIVPEVQLRAGLAQTDLPDFLVDGFVAMQQAFSNGAYDILTGDTERLSGRPPRPLGDVLAASFA